MKNILNNAKGTLLICCRSAKDGEKHPTLLRNKVCVCSIVEERQFIKNKDSLT